MSKAEYYEYSTAASINLPSIPICSWGVSPKVTTTEEIVLDLSKDLKTPYPTTSPNLCASFLYIEKDDTILLERNATSSIFYVVSGAGYFESIDWNQGDIFTCPMGNIKLTAETDSILYSIHDGSLLRYLGAIPNTKLFKPTLYRKKDLEENLQLLTDPDANKNRQGILLGNFSTKESTKTITPTLWALYNKLPSNTFQKPHRHNSVAIDYCIFAGKNVYTLIGKELNSDGTIKNPEKVTWKTKSVFTTPPGLWHSHHNEGEEDAYVLPLQDAGLFTYQRTLDIQFV